MKKQIAIAIITMVFSTQAHAQLGGFFNKVKNKVTSKATQRVDAKVDKAIDKSLDAAEARGSTAAPADEAVENKGSAEAPEDNSVKSNKKFDFIPGEQIIYADDFAADEAGQLPVDWNTNGTGELTTLNKYPGNWLRLHKPFVYFSRNKKEFTENYTIEFDLVLQLKSNGWMYPEMKFGIFSSGEEPNTANSFFKEYEKNAAVTAVIYPGEYQSSRVSMKSYLDNKTYFSSDAKSYGELEKYYGKPLHISIQVQKERVRIWMNQEKLFDAPKAVPIGKLMNQLYFEVGHTNYAEEQYAVYIGNIKVATGKPDTRHKLVEEGTFSTTGILFEVNAAILKPASNAVLKELADVLTKYPDIKIKIIGHTDSDGSDAANLELSKKRAAAVKEALTKDFNIDAARMETDGKGETVPAGDNKTTEGKAQNRRVEFIKL